MKQCKNCKFCEVTPKGNKGKCHRHPPSGGNSMGFVEVYATDWCGDFEQEKK